MARALAYAEKLVRNIRRDEKEGIVLPHGWTFSLVSGGSRRQFEIGSIIERIDNRMAMTCMADFVLLGHQQTGSLGFYKENFFLLRRKIVSIFDTYVFPAFALQTATSKTFVTIKNIH